MHYIGVRWTPLEVAEMNGKTRLAVTRASITSSGVIATIVDVAKMNDGKKEIVIFQSVLKFPPITNGIDASIV